jgi:hypothetical protein
LNCLWSPFFILGLELVDKEIKRPSFLIIMWSPFFTLGFERVDKEIKRPSSLFSCEVLTSHLVKKWSLKKSKFLPHLLSRAVLS